MADFVMKCPYCGMEMAVNNDWIGMEAECPGCKKKLKISAPLQKPTPILKPQSSSQPAGFHQGRSRIAYLILGIFLGSIGIHDFYAGYNSRGLTKLLITLLSCGFLGVISYIWAIIDVATVTVDANGVPMDWQ